jgi:hypothetical protein
MDEDQDDPTAHYFNADFASWGEWFGARYRLRGAQALKTTLAAVAAEPCPAEYLQEASAELAALGLSKPAQLVAQAAITCPSLTDHLQFCQYPDNEDNRTNIAGWLSHQQRQIERIRQRVLRRTGIDIEAEFTGETE